MKHSEHLPVYSQIAYDIASKIVSGEIQEGQRFSGRSLMGSQYGVSSETIRRSLNLLSDMQVISIQQNVGSVVRSRQRAAEYVEQYKANQDLRALKQQLAELISKRDGLNLQINQIFAKITNLEELFHHNERLRTYEFVLEPGGQAVDKSIGGLQFRQKTGATIVAVRRGEEVMLSPSPDIILKEQDVLVVICNLSDISQVSQLMRKPAQE